MQPFYDPFTRPDLPNDVTIPFNSTTPSQRHNKAAPSQRHNTATPSERHNTATPSERHNEL